MADSKLERWLEIFAHLCSNQDACDGKKAHLFGWKLPSVLEAKESIEDVAGKVQSFLFVALLPTEIIDFLYSISPVRLDGGQGIVGFASVKEGC